MAGHAVQLIRALTDYVERYADLNEEPLEGECRSLLADAKTFLHEQAPQRWAFVMSNGHHAVEFEFVERSDADSYPDAVAKAGTECVALYPGTELSAWKVEGARELTQPAPSDPIERMYHEAFAPETPTLADPNDLSAEDRATLAAYYAERRQEEANFERGFRNAVRARNARRAS